MSTVITTNSGMYQKPSNKQRIMGSTAGFIVQSAIAAPVAYALIKTLPQKIQQMNSDIDNFEFNKTMLNTFKETRAAEKGIKIQGYKPDRTLGILDATKEFFKDYKKQGDLFRVLKHPFKVMDEYSVKLIENGLNAGFAPKTNTIHINTEKMGTSFFHELGHAINKTSSPLWKSMQKMRMPLMIASLALPTIALLKDKKAPEEETKNIFDKATTFIKNNVGKLTTLTFVPIIAEELKASTRGNKIAKEMLDPELFAKVVKTNKLGALSYTATAVASGFAAYAANKVKDSIVQPKEIV